MIGHECEDEMEWYEGNPFSDLDPPAYYKNNISPDRVTGPPAYYFDTEYGVILSVDPSERSPGVLYYVDPELTERYEG